MIIENRDKLKNLVMFKKADKFFYFDENGIWRVGLISQIRNFKNLTGYYLFEDGRINIYDIAIFYNQIIKNMAYRRMQEGQTIDDLEMLLETLKITKRERPKGLDRFICRIYKPEFFRLPDNSNKKSFDFIVIEVSILSEEAMADRDEYLKTHIREINKRVIKYLENNTSFIKYGVPIDYLKISNVSLNKRINILRIQFDLKTIETE